MSDPKAAAPAPAAPEAPKQHPLLGKTVRLAGVHGRMNHPFTHAWFEQGDDGRKAEVDAWVVVQLEAGKLRVVTD